MMQLNVEQLHVRYDQLVAVDGLSFALKKGEIGCLLGPSGCGKTTLKRAIAGFEKISHGQIAITGNVVDTPSYSLPTERRKVGMVFQDFALFPHLTVANNIAFGLPQTDERSKAKIVAELLALIDLPGIEKKYPHELSGGQQQRVALARAIAPQPDIILLDEAFSSLDATLRETLARDVRKLLKAKNITALLATHNQFEAFAIADKIGVMNQGKLLQWDQPKTIYREPNCPFVASFIGEGVLIDAQTDKEGLLSCALGPVHSNRALQKNCAYSLLVRPDDLTHDANSTAHFDIIDKCFRGASYLYTLKIADDQHILCELPTTIDYEVGGTLAITTNLKSLVLFEASKNLSA